MAGSASLLYRFGTFVFPFLVGTVVCDRKVYSKKENVCSFADLTLAVRLYTKIRNDMKTHLKRLVVISK